MANQVRSFGLDAELEAKRLAKYDPQLEAEAVNYIKELTGLEKGEKTMHEFLKDGTVLCKALNVLKPGSFRKINESKMAFKQMENINNFLTCVAEYGVPSNDLFQTVDLFENKNMNQVINCIHALSRESWRHEFDGPHIGVKPSIKNKRDFDEQTLNAGKFVPSQQLGNNLGATQAGMTAPGARREIDHLSHNHLRD